MQWIESKRPYISLSLLLNLLEGRYVIGELLIVYAEHSAILMTFIHFIKTFVLPILSDRLRQVLLYDIFFITTHLIIYQAEHLFKMVSMYLTSTSVCK